MNCRFEVHASGDVSLIPDGDGFARRLSRYFANVKAASPHYRGLIETASQAARGPLDILGKMPVTTKETYRTTLLAEALATINGATFVTDFSSGSVASPVIRLCRTVDDLAEQGLTEQVFRRSGLTRGDRVVAMDVGAAQIYDFYSRAARNIGIRDFHYLHLTHQWAQSIAPIRCLQPTVIITTPSLLVRVWPHVAMVWTPEKSPVRIIISIGEPMHSGFREIVERAWNCRIVSFYGTTETGGIGSECCERDGHHFDPELIVPTLISPSRLSAECFEGEACLTTLHVQTQSVVKYAIGDTIRLSTARCVCGEASPRLWFKDRIQDAFCIGGREVQLRDAAGKICRDRPRTG